MHLSSCQGSDFEVKIALLAFVLHHNTYTGDISILTLDAYIYFLKLLL
jgi:hypothetical protein